MRTVIHPRPSPIVAAMYTLRDMEVDVIVVHGPSGCSFMASRPLENAGVRVVTTAMRDNDLIFGASEPLINTLKQVEERFHPETVAVIGTCASMIIGEDMASSIRKAGIDANVFPVDVHACMGDNTRGAIKADAEEIANNPRSASVRLRAVELTRPIPARWRKRFDQCADYASMTRQGRRD